MLSSRLSSYDTSGEDILEHTTELAQRLRIIAGVYFATVITILFIPTSWLVLDFGTEYRPLVLDVLDFMLSWSTSEVTSDKFSITIGSPITVITELFVISLLLAFIINYPFLLYELYLFFSPGLYPNEQRVVKKLVIGATALFSFGAFFGFRLMPIVTKTLVGFADLLNYEKIVQFYDLGNVVDFLIFNVIATGLVFTYPVLIIALVFSGFLSVDDLQKRRRHVILGLFGMTAIITPDPTPVSMIILAIPLVFLYEITINFAYKIETSPDFIEMRQRLQTQWQKSRDNVLEYGAQEQNDN
jgi:sec-independent protein translocase protein TatC